MSEAVRTLLHRSAEAARESASDADLGFLSDFWYPAARSTELRRQKLVKALAVFSEKYKITHLSCELPSHIDHGIIGLMDPAHGPFVHQSWFWRKRASIHEKAKQFEPIPNGF